MSSPNDRNETEFEDQLRQILRAEADEVAPSGEGLHLIRERTERQRGAAWFRLPWLRPAAAVAAATLIAASVVIANPQVRDQVLEIVPAGADRAGTPPEPSQEDAGSTTPPTPTTDSASGTSKPEKEPGQPAENSPSPEDEASAEEEGQESTSSCPPEDEVAPTATDSESGDERDGKQTEDADCDPTGEPTEEPTETPEEPDEGEEDPGSGEEEPDSGSGSGNGGGSNDSGESEESSVSSD
ncbi:hypothetical protein GCM10007079_49760 [Nocardiopsis terrae]|uniref:Type IV secretory pathway VirB10-like protein n=1 Tax=Nocardiopsis terrae TaxID=372655 RepID=A0ABR9HJZ5_9ACTN|nr:hypothetical protein [Nocardiopsis terrae]MBE1459350.1 type IV secretory pathway VirB10-like protein [Nocardiopsis terrae]GHC96826.1 hypothetical protein GCM10007079_49760 [Nocardiopsis terrae]